MQLLNQKLERTLAVKASEQQAEADVEAVAAVQAAAHVASLEQHIQQLKVELYKHWHTAAGASRCATLTAYKSLHILHLRQ